MSDHIVTIDVDAFDRAPIPAREPYVHPLDKQLARIEAIFADTAASIESLRSAVGSQTEEP